MADEGQQQQQPPSQATQQNEPPPLSKIRDERILEIVKKGGGEKDSLGFLRHRCPPLEVRHTTDAP